MKILIIDEKQNCFQQIQQLLKESDGLEIEYFLAETSDRFNEIVEIGKTAQAIAIHNRIWVDDCDPDDDCKRKFLPEFIRRVAPVPVLLVEADDAGCSVAIADVYQQLVQGYKNFGKSINSFVGTKVKSNPRWNAEWLTIDGLEIFGDNQVGCVLGIPGVERKQSKHFKLVELAPYK